jgi:thiosulfate dehydrogenase [quinone] large subunit
MTYTSNQKACLLLRLFLGVLFLFASFGKLTDVSGFADNLVQNFATTMLPNALLVPFAYALPFVELLLGVTLLFGIFTEVMLIVSAVLLLTLFFGMLLKGEGGVAANNALYLLINVCAIRWFEPVAPSVDGILRNRRTAARSS